MLRDLRVKIRNRHSRISSCTHDEFLPLTRQFFAFLAASPILSAVIRELLARNPKSVEEANTTDLSVMVYGETAEEAATVAYTKWKRFSDSNDAHEYYQHVYRARGFEEGLEKYREWYLEPLFEYLDEILEDSNIILATLTRYKHKVEWYRRIELQELFSANESTGENTLAKHMYEYLFDQGIPFVVEPRTASGRPDVLSLEDSNHPFIGDVKIFDASGRGTTYIKKGLYQVYQYCLDCNEAVGYLIVFNVSNKQLRFEIPSTENTPRFEYNHKTIFVTIVDIHDHQSTASKRGLPETATITAEEMIQEMNDQEKSKISQEV